VKLWAARARKIVEGGDDVAVELMPWEQEAERVEVRRGPLLPDTVSVWEP